MKWRAQLAYWAAKVPAYSWIVAAAILILLVALCVRCVPGEDFVQIAGPDGGGLDGEPDAPVSPGPDPTGPVAFLVETTHGDTLYVQAGEHVGVGLRDSLKVEIHAAAERTFAVMVGMEGPVCAAGRAKLVGISPVYAGGSPRLAVLAFHRGLVLSEAFTAWFADACTLIAFFYDIPQGGGLREFYILVEGLAPGDSEVRTQFEIPGFGGENFRWTARSSLEVVP